MAPSTVRRKTISELRKTVRAMMSPAWDRALEGRSRAQITEAAKVLLATQRARLRLGNAELSEIRDRLRANEKPLLEGISRLDRSLQRLKNVKLVLQAATAMLRTVGKIVDVVV